MQADIKEIVKRLRAIDKDVIIVWIGYYNMADTGTTGPAGDFKLTLTEGVAVPKFELDVVVPTEIKWVPVEGRGVFSKRKYTWKEPRVITETQKLKFGGYNVLKVETPVLIKKDEALLPKQCGHSVNVRINQLHDVDHEGARARREAHVLHLAQPPGRAVHEQRDAAADLPRRGDGGQEGRGQGARTARRAGRTRTRRARARSPT